MYIFYEIMILEEFLIKSSIFLVWLNIPILLTLPLANDFIYQGRIHGYLSCKRLGRGSNKAIAISRVPRAISDQQTNGHTNQLTN